MMPSSTTAIVAAMVLTGRRREAEARDKGLRAEGLRLKADC
jgi:hypothetical protein